MNFNRECSLMSAGFKWGPLQSQPRLAEELGCAHRKVNEIVNGKRAISPEFALDLEAVLNTEAEMWVRLQAEFDLHQARKKRDAA